MYYMPIMYKHLSHTYIHTYLNLDHAKNKYGLSDAFIYHHQQQQQQQRHHIIISSSSSSSYINTHVLANCMYVRMYLPTYLHTNSRTTYILIVEQHGELIQQQQLLTIPCWPILIIDTGQLFLVLLDHVFYLLHARVGVLLHWDGHADHCR